LHKAGLLRIVFKGLANFPDSRINAVVGIQKDILTPNLLYDLLAGDELPALLDQQEQ